MTTDDHARPAPIGTVPDAHPDWAADGDRIDICPCSECDDGRRVLAAHAAEIADIPTAEITAIYYPGDHQ